ncbi:T9SS type B sorting domain-containing protein [Marivirga arenosa]|uniref:Gliding motility-associated C-terminal domain-containing protein n=1 Tax=Marivirga arenosa TaxID=3059076 RepID=A0AA51ZUY2_9BACT|nr:gliding motility-associated C-terminal domain-containing protein [Marivirga sp. BKB1-2]WNB17278.1 gliding motility-associated C-terminal domain-containing protein [Marivirga sp. BKB1-2]
MKEFYKFIKSLLAVFILVSFFSYEAKSQCPTAVAANKSHTDISCFGANDGTITVEITDGTPPFNFELFDNNIGSFVTLSVTRTVSGDGRTVVFSDLYPSSFQVVVFKSGCPTIQVTDGLFGFVIDEPTQLTASVNTVVNDCDNTGIGSIDIDVSGGTPDGGGNYFYSWSNLATTQDISGLSPGSYDVTITDDNGCTTSITGITVDPGPDAGTAGTANACNNDASFNLYNVLGGTPDLTGSFTAAGTNPEVVTISQPGDGSTSTADFDGVASGVYVFTYEVTSPGCPPATADVTITVSDAPDAGLDTTVDACSDEGAFDLFSALNGTPQALNGTWTEDPGNPATSILTQGGDGSTGTANLTTALGSYNFIYTVTSAGCIDAVATLTVNVNALPNAGTADAANACNNDASFNLYNVLGGTPDLTGSFTAAGTNPEVVTISQPGDGSTSTADFDGVASGVYVFTYEVTSPGCPPATADVTITVSDAPDAGLDTTVDACSDEGAFDLFSALNGTPQALNGTWTEDPGNPATSILTQGGDGSTGTANLTTALGSYNFIYTVTSAGCIDAVATLTVNVNALPNAGTADAANACNNDASFNLYNVLGGTPDLTGSFTAAGTNPEVVTISQPGDGSTSTADFDGVASGVYVFTYEVTSPGCPPATADVTITVSDAPDAGLDTTVDACSDEGAFDLFSALNGTPQALNGTWTEDPGNPATSILTQGGDGSTGTANLTTALGSYNFIYTVTSAGCIDAVATLTVNVNALPNAGTADAANACNNDASFNLYNVLGGTPDLTGSFTAAGTNPEVVTISQPGDGSTSTADFDGVASGVYVFTYEVTSPGCPPATADVTITVSDAPDAGLDTTVDACSDEGAFDLFSALNGTPQALNGTWTEDPGNPATSILTQGGDGSTGTANLTTALGSYNFIYTVTSAGCIDAVATLTVNVNALPNAGTADAANACNNDASFNLYNVLGGTPDLTGSFTAAGTNPEVVTISQPGDGSTSTADFDGVASGVYVFTYEVTSPGCPPATADVTITVSDAPDAGLDTTVDACSDEGAFDLFSALNGTPQALNGTWTEDPGNPATSILTQGGDGSTGTANLSTALGSYNFIYTVTSAGCIDAVATLTVNVNALPNAGTADAANACNNDASFNLYNVLGGTPDLTGSFTAAGTNPEVVTISQPGDGSTSTADFDGVASGVYVFTYEVTSPGCPPATADVTITVSDAPDAGLDTTVDACSDEGAFDLFSALNGTPQALNGTWTEDPGNPATSILTQGGDGSTGTANLTTALGSYNFIYTVTSAGCIDAVATLTVNVNALPNAGTADAANACNNDASFNLYNVLGGTPDLTGSFTAAGTNPEVVTISQPGDGSTSTADFDGVASGVYVFTYEVTSPGCPPATADVTITVSDAPDAGLDTTVDACSDEGAFDLFSALNGTPQALNGTWTEDPGNPATSILTQGGDGSTGTANLTTALGSYNFIYTVTSAGCIDAVATLTVNVNALPNAGTADAANACNNDASFNLYNVLGGTPDLTGSFTAAGTNPEVVTISQPGDGSTSTADFDGVASGVYVFTYEVTSPGCPPATADVTITVSDAPDAGLDTTVDACSDEGAFDLFSALNGTPQALNGTWTEDPGNPATSILTQGGDGSTGTANLSTALGSYNFIYTVTSAGCIDAVATLTVNVNALPNAGTADAANACNNDASFNLYNVLGGTPDLTGSFTAAGTNPEVVTISQPGDGSTSTADFDGVASGVYVFTYEVTSPGCPPATADVTITVSDAPDAGLDTTVDACSDEGAFDLFSALNGTPQALNGTWTEDPGNPATSILTQGGDGSTGTANLTTALGSYNFIYTVTSAGCIDAVATLTVNVNALPNAGTAQTPANVCDFPASYDLFGMLDGSQDGGGVWSQTTGPSSLTVSPFTGDVDLSAAAVGTYTFTYTVPGSGGCNNASTVVQINIGAISLSGVVSDASGCGVSDGGIDLTVTSSFGGTDTFTFDWTGPNGYTNTLTGVSDGDITSVEGGTYNVTVTSDNTGCVTTASFVINEPILFTIDNFTSTDQSQCGLDDGAVSFDIGSGTGPYNYYIVDTNTLVEVDRSDADPSSTYSFASLAPGDYEVFVEDGACTDSRTFTVAPATLVGGITTTTNQTQCGVNDGSITFEVTTGVGPFNYYVVDTNTSTEVDRSDADPSTTYSFSSLAPGNYEIFVEEGPCVDSETFTINPADQIAAIVNSFTEPNCGATDGVISLEVTDVGNDFDVTYDDGINPPVTSTVVAVTGPQTVDLTGLGQGNYTITITDNSTTCEVVLNQLLNENAPFDIDNSATSITNISTCGSTDGAIDVAITGSFTGPTTFTWTGPAGFTDPNTEDLTGLDIAGDYQLTIEDAGCTIVSNIFTITAPTPPTSVAGADSTICLPTIQLYADALAADQVGEWQIVSQPAGATANIIDPTSPTTSFEDLFELGDYTLAWILENTLTNCSDSDTIVITRKDITIADAGTDIETCSGIVALSGNASGVDETGTWSIISSPAGAVADFDDANIENTNFSINDLTVSGDYVIRWTITDDNNICTETFEDITITYELAPSAGTFNTAPSVNLSTGDSPFDLFTLLDNEDTGGTWALTSSSNAGGTDPSFDVNTGEVDLSIASTGIYEFTYTVNGTLACATDSETVTIDYLNFECEDTKFTAITEDATCQGVQDGEVFLFLQSVSNVDSLDITINSVVMDTFSIKLGNPGSGNLAQIDTTFFAGNYEVILKDLVNSCEDTISVLVGQKQSILPLINTSDATCDNPVGQIQVTIDGTFDFVLLDSTDAPLDTTNTGLFTDLAPAKYGIAFNNTGGCQIDTVKNIIINEPTQVSNSALDLTVVEPSCNTTTAQILINFELEGEYLYQILDTAEVVIDSITTDSGSWTLELDTLGLFELVVTNIDNPGVCEPNSRNFNIERSGGFTATVVDKTDVVCFGDNTGSVTIELDGIGSGFYSLDGFIWNEFISGEPITGLTAQRSILVSDQGGTSECEQSITIDIQHLSQPIEFVGNANITLVTQASCTTAEEIGVIKVPEVTGGVAPYVYSIDGDLVELDSDRNISGLARNADELTITDATGCSETFDIRSIVSPNEIRAEVVEINPTNNCVDEPEGILVTIDQTTIDNVPGPYNLIINKVNDTTTSEYVLNINTNGSREFTISQFDLDNNVPFEKGARYRWTIRATDDDQACSADNFVTINGGAIIPTFDIQANDVACFQESGSIEISNIVADETIPLNIEVYEGNDVDPTQIFTLNSIPESRMFLIDQSLYGMVARGDYIIKLTQQPDNCNSVIESENAAIFIDAPVNQLNVELVPEPNLPPGIERERADMNPMPTTRPDQANGSISIRLVEPTSGANGYSAQIFLLTPLGGNNSADYILPEEPIDFGADQTITFDNLLPGVYEIEYYDTFGCGTDGSKLVFDGEGSSDITVDFDRSPFIPNVFTPNNDGKNDFFRILNLPDNGAELVVTNRNGTIVYRDSNYRNSNLWDGGDNPDGVYFYQLTVDGNTQSGWVEIIRGRR